MELGISTASFFSRIPTVDALTVLKEMGIGVTEIFLSTWSEYEPRFVRKLQSNLCGIKVHSVHALGTQFEPELFSRSVSVRGDAELMLRRFLRAVEILGAKLYTFHGPLRLKRFAGEPDYAFMAGRLKELDAIAGGYGVSLSYENVHYAFGAKPVFFQNVLSHYPDLKTTLDVKQSVLGDNLPEVFLDAMGGGVSTIHICDVTQNHKTAIPGKGSVDFDAFFAHCARCKVKAPVLIESYCGDYTDFDELYSSFLHVKTLMAKHNVLT